MPRKPKPPKFELQVKKSFSGLGLFAGEDIPKDEFIIEYQGPLLNNEQADEKGGKYLFEIDDETVIDGSDRKNLARYINHSCRPNAEAEVDGRRVYIHAKRKISAGEEITYNYGKEYFNDHITAGGCKCPYH